MARAYNKDPIVERSLQHSLSDARAFSVMVGSGETYFSAFAVFLKANTAQIGVLASLPPLIGSFAQLFSAWLGRRIHSRRRIILLGAYLQVASWLPLALLPLLFPQHAVALLIGSVIFYQGAANLIVPQWSSLMGDLVPERKRGRFFARRTRIASIATFTALVCAGLVLDQYARHGVARWGFLTLFAVAATARLISAHHLARMVDPPGKTATMEAVPDRALWSRLRHSKFARFSLFFALMQLSVSIASPFFIVYMLRDLHYSYLEFTANTATSVLLQFLTLNTWGRLSDAFGNRLLLVITGSFIPILPSLWLMSTDFWYLIGVQAFGGLMWAGFSLSAGNFLYDLIPAPKRVTYMAMHNVVANCGIFVGAVLGGWLGALLPRTFTIAGHVLQPTSALCWLFLLSTLVRIAVALLFLPHLKEVRSVRSMSFRRLVFRAARFNALSGLFFEIVGVRRLNTRNMEYGDGAAGKQPGTK